MQAYRAGGPEWEFLTTLLGPEACMKLRSPQQGWLNLGILSRADITDQV